MITRYNANFQDHMMETDEEGRWVKFADFLQAEMLFDVRVEETLQEKIKAEREDLKVKTELAAKLTEENKHLEAMLADISQSQGRVINEQSALIKAAKDRLNLHGHTPNCESRYKAVEANGSERHGECNCGLFSWMEESELHG